MAHQPVYASDPDAAPDSDFLPGELTHVVPGNHGRLLDARRTPVTITAVVPERAAFEVEIDGFEDTGARWELSLEEIIRFQFARGGAMAGPARVAELHRLRDRFAHDVQITGDPSNRTATRERIAAERAAIRMWLDGRPTASQDLEALVGRREGDAGAFALIEDLMAERGLAELERSFAETFVSNPASGELVKGHAIVLAELGLCPYSGRVVRDPTLFGGPWTAERRAEHIVIRLAFLQELWAAAWRADSATLYRGAATDGPLPARAPSSFVSATFSASVAEEHFAGGRSTATAVLWRQVVPVSRLFMTFVETRALNRRFREAEAVLLGDPENRAF